MKKLLLLILLLFSTLTFSQTIKVFNDPVKFRNTASEASPTLFMTKSVNDLLTETTFAELQALLGIGTFLENIVEDTTPQLGGNLDLNGFDITGIGNINFTGNLTTVDFTSSGDVLLSNYPSTRIDAPPINMLHTDLNGNLLSSQISSLGVVTKTSDLTNDGEDGINPFLDTADVIESPFQETDVSATWVTGLTFDVRADKFPVDGIYFSATQANVILDAADVTFDRIDLIIANTSNTVGKITGIASANPAQPSYDASTEYAIKFILVKANETTPDGFSNELVFDEDVGEPTEWTLTSFSGTSVTANDPFNGTVSIEGTATSFSISQFINDVSVNLDSTNTLSFWFKLKADFGNSKINIDFYNNNARVGSLFIKDGKNGFDASSLIYQQIVVDVGKLNLGSTEIDQFNIVPFKGGFAGYFIDLVELQFQTTISDPTSTTNPIVFTELIDTPPNYIGEGGKIVSVKMTEDGLEFVNAPSLSEINDLSAVVTWANVPDANITQSSVTQHQAALSVTASQVSDFDTEVSNNTSVAANTAKNTNVTTNLSLGTVTATTMDVNSSDGTNATLIEADTDDAGLLGSDKWDEIVANTSKTSNATHTSEVTGSTALTIASGVVDTDNLADELKAESAISALDVDWSDGIHFTKTLSGNTTLTFSNFTVGKTITLEIDGNFTLTLPVGVEGDLSGFDGALTNIIQLYCVDAGTPKFITALINY